MNKEQEAFEWLDKNELSYTIWNNKYRYKEESFKKWLSRVSGNNEFIKQLIKDKKFLFGGRTLSNRGTNQGSYNNCYSIGYVPDSLSGILDVNTKIALTYKAQGGEGLSLSKIRPKGAIIKENYTSDGIIPFMEMFNTTTSSISQGGSRKGALMMSLDVWHPEIISFITIKSDKDKINFANLSVEIDDKFMEYVEHYINTGECIKVDKEFKYKDKIFKYTVDVMQVFNTICEYSRKHAEPGIIFTNQFRNFNIMEFVNSYQIETCNPCGEQPLPKNGCCCLSSINLSEYILLPYTKDAMIDFNTLAIDIYTIVEAMDSLIDENADNHAIQEQKDMALDYRNIGIGYMGVADMLVKLQLTYGSSDAINTIEVLGEFIFRKAVMASAALAKRKGSFPKYVDEVYDSNIMKSHFTDKELIELKTLGLRNCALLSIAPTGSIGTMLNISTGCEPYFALSYNRKTISLNKEETIYKVYVKEADYYLNNINSELPDYFVESKNIDYVDRIKMQAVMQKHIDTAISSTINLPKNTTNEEILKLYYLSWSHNLKGVTIYVEGSRDPILSTSDTHNIEGRQSPKRPDILEADFYTVKVQGEQFVVLVGLLEDVPYEVFTFRPQNPINIEQHKGIITRNKKKHYSYDSEFINISDIQLANDNIEEKAATLYSSMLLRHGVDINYIVKTAKKVNENITSFSSAMCRILSKYIPDGETGEICPECNGKIIREGGCIRCQDCGFSRCG